MGKTMNSKGKQSHNTRARRKASEAAKAVESTK